MSLEPPDRSDDFRLPIQLGRECFGKSVKIAPDSLPFLKVSPENLDQLQTYQRQTRALVNFLRDELPDLNQPSDTTGWGELAYRAELWSESRGVFDRHNFFDCIRVLQLARDDETHQKVQAALSSILTSLNEGFTLCQQNGKLCETHQKYFARQLDAFVSKADMFFFEATGGREVFFHHKNYRPLNESQWIRNVPDSIIGSVGERIVEVSALIPQILAQIILSNLENVDRKILLSSLIRVSKSIINCAFVLEYTDPGSQAAIKLFKQSNIILKNLLGDTLISRRIFSEFIERELDRLEIPGREFLAVASEFALLKDISQGLLFFNQFGINKSGSGETKDAIFQLQSTVRETSEAVINHPRFIASVNPGIRKISQQMEAALSKFEKWRVFTT